MEFQEVQGGWSSWYSDDQSNGPSQLPSELSATSAPKETLGSFQLVLSSTSHVRVGMENTTLGVGTHGRRNQTTSDGMITVVSSPSVLLWVNALSCREVTQLREDTGLCGISGGASYGPAPSSQCIQDEEFVSFGHRTRRSCSNWASTHIPCVCCLLLVAMAEFMFLLTLELKQLENSGVSRHRILLLKKFHPKANEVEVCDPPKSLF